MTSLLGLPLSLAIAIAAHACFLAGITAALWAFAILAWLDEIGVGPALISALLNRRANGAVHDHRDALPGLRFRS